MQLFSFKKGFLKKQKVYKRNPKGKKKKKSNQSKATLIVVASLLFLFFFFLLRANTNHYKNKFVKLDSSWEITFSSQEMNESKALKKILVNSSQSKTLESLTEAIQKKHPFSKTTVIQTAPKKLHIQIKEKQIVMAVAADKKRYVSKEGDVYGLAKNEDIPLLTGVFFREKKDYAFSKRNSLIVTKSENEKIKKAILIKKEALKKNLLIKKIKFTPYRGFSVLLKSGTWIVLGNRSFPYKIKKFVEVKKRLTHENKKITYIELDYKGKAFIKTSNTGAQGES